MWFSNEYCDFFTPIEKVDFDAVVDHLAIMHIMRNKAEPATTRIKRLIELLNPYSFNLYYIKGKDMVLSDFLSRQKNDYSNPHEIIPISFTLKSLAHEHFIDLTVQLGSMRQKQTNIKYKLGHKQNLVALKYQKYMV